MTLLGRPELITDDRFVDDGSRFVNRTELIHILDDIFAEHTLADWKVKLRPLTGAWAAVQASAELTNDPAVNANGYIPTVKTVQGTSFPLAVNPVQFDEKQIAPQGAPEHGQHTEEVLLEAGIEWERIEKYKSEGAIT
jgi:crotonobetainyl-CoA:carnitine CoA-transferase CaiB-like acyl-CoA transferase